MAALATSDTATRYRGQPRVGRTVSPSWSTRTRQLADPNTDSASTTGTIASGQTPRSAITNTTTAVTTAVTAESAMTTQVENRACPTQTTISPGATGTGGVAGSRLDAPDTAGGRKNQAPTASANAIPTAMPRVGRMVGVDAPTGRPR